MNSNANPFLPITNDPAARFKVTFINRDANIVAAFQKSLDIAHIPRGITVEVKLQDFNDLQEPFDCVVSPANSIGHGDGGFDDVLWEYFGHDFFPVKVQSMIVEKYGGEQPIGTSEIVRTGHPKIPYVAHAPTMYLPDIIKDTQNAYIAMWAIMLSVYQHNLNVLRNLNGQDKFISSVLCTTLGTGVGAMRPNVAAEQHIRALTNFYNRYTIFEYNSLKREHDNVKLHPRKDAPFLLKWDWGLKREDIFSKKDYEEFLYLKRMKEGIVRDELK
ncbi:hypothetical protein BKA69DRAFT_1175859 [Paraphysoderma sedebokerense]|nr:hypothetical protein BKA69DRAFT_1175859 [Paraphysoderma sedebokerense]